MNRRYSSHSGTSMIELCVGLCIIVPIVLFAVDVLTVFFGYSLVSVACRDAARSASNGRPGDLTQAHTNENLTNQSAPYARAMTAISNYHPGGVISFDPNIQVWETIDGPLPTAPFGGMANGQVTVKMQAIVSPPVVLAMLPKVVYIPVQQTFPYTWVMPSTLYPDTRSLSGNCF